MAEMESQNCPTTYRHKIESILLFNHSVEDCPGKKKTKKKTNNNKKKTNQQQQQKNCSKRD